MRLYVTIVSAPGLPPPSGSEASDGPLAHLGDGAVELAVDMERGAVGELLERELAPALRPDVRFWLDGRELKTLSAGEAPFVSGAVIIAAPGLRPPPRGKPAEHHLCFATLSGPDSGQLVTLVRGTYSVGRTGCDINIQDPALSRTHAQLSVTPTSVVVRDCNSTNGLHVGGIRRTTALITTDSTLAFGATSGALRFDKSEPSPTSESVDVDEPLIVQRTDPGHNRGRLLVLAALPLLVGAGLAWLTGSWMFLAFSAMSAITVGMPAIAGMRRRRGYRTALRAAGEADDLRRRRAAPPIADIMLALYNQAKAGPSAVNEGSPRLIHAQHSTAEKGHLWIRLGLADQPSNIALAPPDPAFLPPTLRAAPVLLDIHALDDVCIEGAALQVAALSRSVVLQLTRPGCGPLRIILAGSPKDLPLGARFLPGVVLATTPSALQQRLADAARGSTVLMVFGAEVATDLIPAAGARTGTASAPFTVIWCSAVGAPVDAPRLILAETMAFLHRNGSTLSFTPDFVSAQTFDRYTRIRPRFTAGGPLRQLGPDALSVPQLLPEACPLDTVAACGVSDILAVWRNPPASDLEAVLGLAISGPVFLDLQQDGPHLLVAGTTGSGKSELLRALILSLAQRYAPERLSLLFVDFKGGSGLGPLQALPHCVGMLTDLSAEGVSRALISLKAEVKRRERLLAFVQADNLAMYRRLAPASAEPLPHLVLVMDEFLMLKEEVPTAVDELVRLATVGRSLGIHLILATQRPQGAISADIRANVTTTVALRVRTGYESQDLIEVPDAAALAASAPGRAYLKRSGAPPVAFQSASTAHSSDSADEGSRCIVQDMLSSFADHDAAGPGPAHSEATLPMYIELVVRASSLIGRFSMRQPIAQALPLALPEIFHVGVPRAEGTPMVARLGLVDLPALQRVDDLSWQPVRHSHLALVGSTGSGLHHGMRSVLAQWLQHDPTRNHLFVLDADGSLASTRDYPQVGSYAGSDELRLAVRILDRLCEALTERMSLPHPAQRPLIGLVVNGWGRWVAALRAGGWAQAEDRLMDLVRDGAGAGLAVLISGDRELPAARFFASIPNRLYLPAGTSPESRLMWPRLPAMKETPGRAFVQGPMVAEPGVAQLVQCTRIAPVQRLRPGPALQRLQESAGAPAFRIESLPKHLEASSLRGSVVDGEELLIGVAGDDPHPVALPLRPAEVLLILGPPRSGKTTALTSLQELNSAARTWKRCDQLDAAAFWHDYRVASATAPADVTSSTVLLIDDADRLPPGAQADIAALQGSGYAVVMTAASGPTAAARIPLALQARSMGRGLILMPQTTFDGDFFGVRAQAEARFIPGRAVLVNAGHTEQVQLACSCGGSA